MQSGPPMGMGLAAGSGPPATATAGDGEVVAREVAQDLVDHRYGAIVARFDAAMVAALSEEKLKSSWEPMAPTLGKLERLGTSRIETIGGRALVVVPLIFEHNSLDLRVAVDAQAKVAGLFIAPSAPTQSWSPPSYAPESFVERPLAVGPLALPGSLVLPVGPGPFACAVLVHGSGPNDADETLGSNKPFRDLALGLAGRGIATVRYEKRTHARPAAFTLDHPYTVKEEVIDDAVAAVRLAASTPGLDAKRVWIIGHSWGGYLAPRIAAAAADVAGLVVLAGSTRPLEDLLVEQITYLNGPGAPAVAAIEATARTVRDPGLSAAQIVDVLGAKLPGSYFLDLRSYDAARTAAGLRIPVLVLQGDRDYQVRRADYDGWERVLHGHSGARFKRYPGLNHLFQEGTEASRPSEYLRPGMHVAPAVIADIASFIAT